MPANPLHALVLLPLYFKRPGVFDPAALVVSAVAIDLEVIYAYIIGFPSPHMALHSFFAVLTVYPLVVSLFTYFVERKMSKRLRAVYLRLGWEDRVVYPFRTIFACSLLGGLSHVLLDAWTHPVSPFIFWPFVYLPSNPLYMGGWSITIDAFVVLLSAYAIYLWWLRREKAPEQKKQ